jgi:hypothetical protein
MNPGFIPASKGDPYLFYFDPIYNWMKKGDEQTDGRRLSPKWIFASPILGKEYRPNLKDRKFISGPKPSGIGPSFADCTREAIPCPPKPTVPNSPHIPRYWALMGSL